jgi:hypothetical protein
MTLHVGIKVMILMHGIVLNHYMYHAKVLFEDHPWMKKMYMCIKDTTINGV